MRSFLFFIERKTSINLLYKAEAIIGKGTISDAKIVQQNMKRILKDLAPESFRRFLSDCEIIFLFSYPCIIRVCGFNNVDEDHQPSMIIFLFNLIFTFHNY